MLDNQNVIDQRDPQDALGFIKQQPKQLQHDFGIARQKQDKKITKVVFAGMGGSSLIAEIVLSYPKLKVPFVISKTYRLPEFVDQDTLVICASYSGNTEETIEALSHAEEKQAQIVIVTHGGKLADIAREKGYMFAELPESPQPRTGIFYAYRAACEIFVAYSLIKEDVIDELESVVEPLEGKTSLWAPSVPEEQNYAKQLAQQMAGKTPIIYGGTLTYPAAYKWKISANENAKNTAWCNAIPEFNHNEFIGWSSHPVEKPFAVIDLLSSFEHPRILKRFEVSDRLLSGMRPKAIEIHAEGDSIVEQLLYLVLLGDYATTYLAILNGVNPTPVVLVEKFKKELES